MNKYSQYDCISPNWFKIWSRSFLVVILGISLSIVIKAIKINFIVFIIAGLLFLMVQIILTYISISKYNENMTIDYRNKSFQYKSLKNAELKWCYGFGNSSPEMLAEGGSGKSQARINVINITLILQFESEIIYLVEQIYMSEKFPHNIPYDENLNLKANKMFKVWNVEKCIRKLEIEPCNKK